MSKAYANQILAVALAEVGYLEKASNACLDDKTANAGNANYTKYARDLDNIPGWYNSKKNGYPWCDVFVDWCMVQAFGEDKARELLNHGTLGAGCPYSAQYYISVGRWHTSDPQPGDQVFFGTKPETATHTGLVHKVENGRVYTVEGNTGAGDDVVIANGGAVAPKSYSLTSSKICGYGRPNYDGQEEHEMTEEEIKQTAREAAEEKAAEVATEKAQEAAEEAAKNALDDLMDGTGSGDAHGKYSTAAIQWATENGLIKGLGNGDYAWKKPMTREEMVTLLYRYHTGL